MLRMRKTSLKAEEWQGTYVGFFRAQLSKFRQWRESGERNSWTPLTSGEEETKRKK